MQPYRYTAIYLFSDTRTTVVDPAAYLSIHVAAACLARAISRYEQLPLYWLGLAGALVLAGALRDAHVLDTVQRRKHRCR